MKMLSVALFFQLTLVDSADVCSEASNSSCPGAEEEKSMKVSMLQRQGRTESIARRAELLAELDGVEGELALSDATGDEPAPGSCPRVAGLESEVVLKPGFSAVCKWNNVRYARIKTDEPTGKRTSGSKEMITYGDWGPAEKAKGSAFEHIKSNQLGGAVVPGTIRCYQMQSETGKKPRPTGQADCLGAQIYAPEGADMSRQFPVAVWIHGGMYIIGSSDDWVYEASRLTSRGLVVVVINYRLQSYGFSTFDALTRNNGVRDQRQAIEWVHENIAAWRGDPNQISVFGESAGATSTTVQTLYEMHHPEVPQLIKRAVIQSNPLGIILENPSHKKDIWEKWEMKKGPGKCSSKDHCRKIIGIRKCDENDAFQCMKENGASDVLSKGAGMMMSEIGLHDPILKRVLQNFYGYGPCLDGEFVMKQPKDDVPNIKIPTMQGTNREEGGFFSSIIKEALMAIGKPFDLDEHTSLVKPTTIMIFGLNIYQHYKDGKEKGFAKLAMPFTDFLFTCPMRKNLGKQAGRVFRYQIHSQDACSGPCKRANDCESVNKGCIGIACHANEVPVVFGTWAEDGSCCSASDVAAYEEYSRALGDLWYKFLSGTDPWRPASDNTKVKILGMKQKGGLIDSHGSIGEYEVHATDPETGGILTGGKDHVCNRMEKDYEHE